MSQWSFQIRIDEDSKDVNIEFTPQHLMPAEYGIVFACMISHLVKCFRESNPLVTEEVLLKEVLDGIQAGLEQRAQLPPQLSH